jgi:hypothetical protein
MDAIKSTVWVAVNKALETSEHSTKEEAIANSDWVFFHEITGSWRNYSYLNPAYDAHFYTNEGIRFSGAVRNNWVLFGPTMETRGNYSRVYANFAIMDPEGKCKVQNFGGYRQGILEGLAFFQVVSKYHSWEVYNSNPDSDPSPTKDEQILQLQDENAQLNEKLESIRRVLEG